MKNKSLAKGLNALQYRNGRLQFKLFCTLYNFLSIDFYRSGNELVVALIILGGTTSDGPQFFSLLTFLRSDKQLSFPCMTQWIMTKYKNGMVSR